MTTEQRETRPRLGESGRPVDSVDDYAIVLLGPDGIINACNTGAKQIFGYTESELVGRHLSVLYSQADLNAGKPERALETAARKGRAEEPGFNARKDGTSFWATTDITALRDENGEIRGFAAGIRDLTRQQRTTEDLRQSAEIFQLLVSSVRDYAIFMLDVDGRVATWNTGAENLKGYKPGEIIGRHFSAFYPPEDLEKPERELAIAREKGSVEDEGWRLRKDGSRFWANVVITAIRDASGELRGFAKVTRDITERRNSDETRRALFEQREARLIAEQERTRAEAAYRVAQEANRAKDEFLMTLSHELRTPMTAILGWSSLLASFTPGDPQILDAISSIATNAQLQARLIDDILDVSRIVSGKLRLTPGTVEISPLIMNAVDSVRATADAKEISIKTAIPPNLGSIFADGTRIQQVVWNLLSNALKFTPQHGEVKVSVEKTASQLQISVTDNGEGIDPDFLPHVFERFRQAEQPSTRTHGGLGLGLSIVRYIAEAHGGSISAASEGRGAGAAFTLTLPIQSASLDDNEAQNGGAKPFIHRNRLRGFDIVLTDDNDESRKVITAILTASGASVRSFGSAREAIAAIDERQPDLLITDIAMPEMDGYALTHLLRERPYGSELRIIALSAFPPGQSQGREFDSYLSKPIDPSELVDEIAKIPPR